MMSSRAALAALAAIAVVLGALIVLEPARAPEDHSLAPDLDVGQIRQLAIGNVRLERDDRGWKWIEPAGRADDATVEALLAALRGGRWHRRAAREAAGTPRVTVTAGGHTFGIGAALPGANQTWIAREHDAVLVDDWVARALAPEPVELRVHHPFADMPPHSAAYRVSRTFARDRTAAYAELEPVEVPPCTSADVVLVPAASGDACLDEHRYRNARAYDAWPPPIETAPVPFAPLKIELADHHVLELAKRPQLDGHDADPEHVAELVAVLTASATDVDVPARAPDAQVVATGLHDSVSLDVFAAEHRVARHGEPRALQLDNTAWSALARPSSAYRDPTRWLEDATTISTITIDGKASHRGATLGAWTDAKDPALLEALAAALATVRAPTGPAPAHVEHTIELAVTPPAGEPRSHKLELGAHCAALADGEPIALPLPACTAATAAATR